MRVNRQLPMLPDQSVRTGVDYVMAPPMVTPRSSWVEAGLAALASGGPQAVRIEPIAASLGVSRGGFYGQFRSRKAFLDAILDAWEHAATDEVLDRVDRKGGDARSRIRRTGALTFSDVLLPVELSVRNWARQDPEVAARLRRVDNRRMTVLREFFSAPGRRPEEIEGRAVLAFTLAIGSHFMASDHSPLGRAGALEAAFAVLS